MKENNKICPDCIIVYERLEREIKERSKSEFDFEGFKKDMQRGRKMTQEEQEAEVIGDILKKNIKK
jgi:predicted DsbA family dithiol-disulfide isomerase